MNHPKPILDALKRPLPPELADALAARFGERFTVAQAVRDHHGKDESPFPTVPPDAVVFAALDRRRWSTIVEPVPRAPVSR